MIYNISKIIYEIMKDYFRESFLGIFTFVVEKVYKLLSENVSEEYCWKGQFSWILFNCLMDSKNQVEALKILNSLWENSKKKNYDFHETLFRQRIMICQNYNIPALHKQIEKEVEKMPEKKLKNIFLLQSMKCGLIAENLVEKQINSILRDLNQENTNESEGGILKPEYYEIYSEIARVSVHYGIISIADQLLTAMKLLSRNNYRAQYLMEIVKAEILIISSKKEEKAQNTYSLHNKDKEIKNRKEALDIIQNALKLNKYIKDPWLIYEGCVLLWNISLPFINDQYKLLLYKGFEIAVKLLDETFCNDYELRIKMLYELSKIDKEDNELDKALKKALRALELSNYTNEEFYKPKLKELLEEINLKKGMFVSKNLEKISVLYKFFEKLENKQVLPRKHVILDFFEQIKNIEEPMKKINKDNISVENFSEKENFDKENFNSNLNNNFVDIKKKKDLLISKLCKIAFDNNLFYLVIDIGNYILEKKWNNSSENQEIKIQQILTEFLIVEALIQILLENGYQFALEKNERITNKKILVEMKTEVINEYKKKIVDHFLNGLETAYKIKQKWLIFNAGIILWNNYLPVFKNSINDSKLYHRTINVLEKYVEILRIAIKEEEKKKLSDYDLEKKIQVFGNITIIYCRLLEAKDEYQKVLPVCEDLLLSSLSIHTRKLINSIRARMIKQLKLNNNNKKNKKGTNIESINDKNEQLLFEIIFKIEIIQNNNNNEEIVKNLKECFDLMLEWANEMKEEIDLDLSCELWTKIANSALNEKSFEMAKLAIKCLDFALNKPKLKIKRTKNGKRWYALAEYLYAKANCSLIIKEGLDFETKDFLLFRALQFLISACGKILKCKYKKMFLDCVKKFYKIVIEIFGNFKTNENLVLLEKPLFSLFFYFKEGKENFEELMKDMNLSKMLINLINIYYTCVEESKNWTLAETACNLLLDIVDIDFRKNIWFVKIRILAKMNRKEDEILDMLRECHPDIQNQLLVQMAYFSDSPQKQYFALSKSIEISKSEKNIMIVEILMDLSEFLFRNNFCKEKIKIQLFSVIDTILLQKIEEKDINSNLDNNLEKENYIPYSFEIRNKKFFLKKYMDDKEKKVKLDYEIFYLEKVFRVHCMLSKIADTNKEKIRYISDAFYFLHLILKLNHERVFTLLKKQKEKNIGSFPNSLKDWFSFDYDSKIILIINKEEDKRFFSKVSFLKKNLTFYYLIYILEVLFDMRMLFKCVIVTKFIELYGKIIFQSEKLMNFTKFQLIYLSHLLNKNDISKNYLKNLDLKKINKSYFNTIYDKIILNKSPENNYKQNSSNSNIIVNIVEEWEFWLKISKILFFLNKKELSLLFLKEYIKIVKFYGFKEFYGEALLQMAIYFIDKGDSKKAEYFFIEAKNNIKTLKNWKSYIKNIAYFFISNNRFEDLKIVFDSFKNILKKTEDTRNKKNFNLSNIKYIYSLIEIFGAEALLKEFSLFGKNYIIESSKIYYENFRRVFKVIMLNLNNFKKLIIKNFDYTLLKILSNYLEKLYFNLKTIKIVSKKVLKYLYLVVNTILRILNQIQLNCQDLYIYNNLAFSSKPKNDKSYLILGELIRTKFWWSRFLNLIFKLKEIHQKILLPFPIIEQKSLESIIFDEEENFEENIVEKNQEKVETLILLQKYFAFNEENDMARLIVDKNLSTLDSLISEDFLTKKYFLEKEIMLERYISEFKRSSIVSYIEDISLNSDNILDDLQNYQKEKDNVDNLENDRIEKLKKNIIINIKNLEFIGFGEFLSYSFYYYNKTRFSNLIKRSNEENFLDIEYINFFIDLQSVSCQEDIFNFFRENSLKNNKDLLKIEYILKKKDLNFYEEFKKDNHLCELFFETNRLVNEIQNLPQNSIYFSLQFDQNSFELLFCIFYIDNQKEIKNYKYNLFDSKQSKRFINEIKMFFKKSTDFSTKLKDNEIEDDKNIIDYNSFYEYILNQNKYLEIKKVLKIIEEFCDLNMIVEEIKNTKKKDKKNSEEPEEKKFNSFWFLLDINFIDFPFEILLKNLLKKKFTYFSRDLSIHNLSIKIKKAKIIEIEKEDNFYMTIQNPNVIDMEEISKPFKKLEKTIKKGITKDEDLIISDGEWTKILLKTKIFFFNSHYDFFGNYCIKNFLENSQNFDLKICFFFDRMKLMNPDFFRYSRKRQLEVDYKRSRIFIYTTNIANLIFTVFPRFYFSSKENMEIIDSYEKILEEGKGFVQICKVFDKIADFNFLGYPEITIKQKKKK